MIWRIDLLPPRSLRGLHLGASATAVAVALLASPMPAFGDNECGVTAPGGTATCTVADGPVFGNPFEDGITYTVDDLTIVLESGVVVDTDDVAKPGVSTKAAGALVVLALPGSEITTTFDDSAGVYANSTDGPVTVSVAAVTTLGDYAEGVHANSTGDGAVSVTATGPISL